MLLPAYQDQRFERMSKTLMRHGKLPESAQEGGRHLLRATNTVTAGGQSLQVGTSRHNSRRAYANGLKTDFAAQQTAAGMSGRVSSSGKRAPPSSEDRVMVVCPVVGCNYPINLLNIDDQQKHISACRREAASVFPQVMHTLAHAYAL